MVESLLNISIDTSRAPHSFDPDGSVFINGVRNNDQSKVDVSEEAALAGRLVAAEEHDLIRRSEEKAAFAGSHAQAMRRRQEFGLGAIR